MTIWQPMQIPKIGLPLSKTSNRAWSNPDWRSLPMAWPAAPTPGKMTRSDLRIRSGAALTLAWMPMAARARSTEVRLPAP